MPGESHQNSLKYVREERKLSLFAVAKELGTSERQLKKFEDGETTPSLKQYAVLEKIYGVPAYLLAGTRKPNLEPLPLDFRKEHAAPIETSPKGLAAYFGRTDVANTIASVANISSFEESFKTIKPIPSHSLKTSIHSLHNILHFNPESRENINNPSLAFRKLRISVEKLKVFCFMAAVPPADYRGLYTTTFNEWGICLINKKTFSDKARSFTLIHELAHHLTGKVGVSDPLITRNTLESRCNEFASEFLAPSEMFDRLQRHSFERYRSTSERVRYISDSCLLSKGATAYRLQRDEYISRSEYSQWLAINGMPLDYGAEDPVEESDTSEEKESGGRWAYNVIADFGYLPVKIVQHAIANKSIDETDAGRILNARGDSLEQVFKTVDDRIRETPPDV